MPSDSPKTSATQAAPAQSGKIPSYQLSKAPDVPLLTDYLHKVMENDPELLELRWPSEKADGFYSLIMRSAGTSGEVKWSFHFASDLLWNYMSCDVLLIHNMISMAGSKQQKMIHGDGLLATSKTYRHVTSSPDTYFIRSVASLDSQSDEPSAEAIEETEKKSALRAIEAKHIDFPAIETVMLKLRDPQTGLYTYPAFLYILEQAYFLSCRTRAPISIVLIELSKGSEKNSQLTKEEIFGLVTYLTAAKRRTDIIAQYESDNIVLLAPSTDQYGIRTFGRRLYQALETALSTLEKKEISFSLGFATYPKDGESLGILLATAEAAKDYARKCNIHMASSDDIK